MKVWHRIFEIYVRASIHVALAVLAFLFLTCLFLNIPAERSLFFFVFFSTIPTYNLIKHLTENRRQFFGILSMNRSHLILSLGSLVISAYFVVDLRWQTLVAILCLSLLTAVYAMPVLPRGKNLRNVGILKIFIIGGVWSGVTVVLPVLEASSLNSWDVWVEFTQRFLVILVLMVPFEIRDLSTDPSDMLTIPQRLGDRKTKKLGMLACLIFFLLTFVKDELSEVEILSKAIMVISLTALLVFLPKRQPRYFASFWVEAFPIFWVTVLWGLSAWV
ncbi:hypothetical protein SAMN06265375_102548 [Muriicola jejuensis]|uniref:Prenyltransferase n=1 Tax=Muriicola jejuensis TaxID=504488 RepID=A0A6P0UBS3_9FLAO|nr:hypothetical protein [Muriicola jejuensis]NER10477.1 hypothetical protein [Muriicola jejuensis]SMP18578.1 hypothetical protein SAMN06265375_102548 [Muriicola jejuensis]